MSTAAQDQSENRLRTAFAVFVEETSTQEALEAVAREIYDRAREAGPQKREDLLAAVEIVERAAEAVGAIL